MLDACFGRLVRSVATRAVRFVRRRNPIYRRWFNAVFRKPLFRLAESFVSIRRRNEHLGIAVEKFLPDEEEITQQIVASMGAFLRKHSL